MMIRCSQGDIVRFSAIDMLKSCIFPTKVNGEDVTDKYKQIMNKYRNKDIDLLFKNRDKELIECLDIIVEDTNINCDLKLDEAIEGFILDLNDEARFYSDEYIEKMLIKEL